MSVMREVHDVREASTRSLVSVVVIMAGIALAFFEFLAHAAKG